MSADAEVLLVVQEWVGKAENDPRIVAHTLKLELSTDQCASSARTSRSRNTEAGGRAPERRQRS